MDANGPFIIGLVLSGVFFLAFALLVGALAHNRNRSRLGWFLIAVVVSPLIAVAILLLLPKSPAPRTEMSADGLFFEVGGEKFAKCPFCAETIRRDAAICRFCSKEVAEGFREYDSKMALAREEEAIRLALARSDIADQAAQKRAKFRKLIKKPRFYLSAVAVVAVAIAAGLILTVQNDDAKSASEPAQIIGVAVSEKGGCPTYVFSFDTSRDEAIARHHGAVGNGWMDKIEVGGFSGYRTPGQKFVNVHDDTVGADGDLTTCFDGSVLYAFQDQRIEFSRRTSIPKFEDSGTTSAPLIVNWRKPELTFAAEVPDPNDFHVVKLRFTSMSASPATLYCDGEKKEYAWTCLAYAEFTETVITAGNPAGDVRKIVALTGT